MAVLSSTFKTCIVLITRIFAQERNIYFEQKNSTVNEKLALQCACGGLLTSFIMFQLKVLDFSF